MKATGSRAPRRTRPRTAKARAPAARRTSRDASALDRLNPEEVQRIKGELWAGDPGARLRGAAPERRLVAEGDSWFDYPPGLDLLDNLKQSFGYDIFKVAEAGDTLENMAYGTEIRLDFSRRPPPLIETMRAIQEHRPRALLLSAGGNHLVGDAFMAYLNHVDSGRALLREDYLQFMVLTVFREGYRHIIRQARAIQPELPVVVHGYAYAIPDGRAVINFPFGFKFVGPWLLPALARKGVARPAEREDVVRRLIDLFNEMLMDLAREDPNVRYVDLRPLVTRKDWANELHLKSGAYLRGAAAFDAVLQQLP